MTAMRAIKAIKRMASETRGFRSRASVCGAELARRLRLTTRDRQCLLAQTDDPALRKACSWQLRRFIYANSDHPGMKRE